MAVVPVVLDSARAVSLQTIILLRAENEDRRVKRSRRCQCFDGMTSAKLVRPLVLSIDLQALSRDGS